MFLEINIPEDISITIREMGVVDTSDVVLFLTQCSDLFKRDGNKMRIVYRISKEII